MENKRIVFASNNKNKIAEVKKILTGYQLLSLNEIGFEGDIEENGETLKDNAIIKARAVREYVLSKGLNLPVLADDTGLCVNALNGAPGVYSARYAGVHGDNDSNIAKVLSELQNKEDRSANFTCVMALIDTSDNLITCEGKAEGEILKERKGTSGFGYDSIFYSFEAKNSFAEISEAHKNSISHRAKALVELEKILNEVEEI